MPPTVLLATTTSCDIFWLERRRCIYGRIKEADAPPRRGERGKRKCNHDNLHFGIFYSNNITIIVQLPRLNTVKWSWQRNLKYHDHQPAGRCCAGCGGERERSQVEHVTGNVLQSDSEMENHPVEFISSANRSPFAEGVWSLLGTGSGVFTFKCKSLFLAHSSSNSTDSEDMYIPRIFYSDSRRFSSTTSSSPLWNAEERFSLPGHPMDWKEKHKGCRKNKTYCQSVVSVRYLTWLMESQSARGLLSISKKGLNWDAKTHAKDRNPF